MADVFHALSTHQIRAATLFNGDDSLSSQLRPSRSNWLQLLMDSDALGSRLAGNDRYRLDACRCSS